MSLSVSVGMSVGVVVAGQTQEEKRAAYAADITYGTNNEFGFDYLRDNMAFSLKDKAQRGQHFAIVDEVDSILIDEARTPLIISGPTDDDPALWGKLNAVIPQLTRQAEEDGEGDFWADEKSRQVHLSEAGMEHVEDILRNTGLLAEDDALYDATNIVLVHQPSIWLKTDSDIDLMLCGHTHNGQIWPFNLLVRLQFRHVYGLFVEGVSNLYVSSGVGCWGPRMRLGSRNEIVLIELRPV